jgi:hypothetical protein
LSDSDLEEEEEEASNSDSDDDEPVKQFSFPQLDAEIRSVLARYDGAVFPKLNWSSPQVRTGSSSRCNMPFLRAKADLTLFSQDAAWMIPGQNLKCQNPADVYLLLKSSDFISHDLDHAFDECVDFDSSAPSTSSADTPDVSNLSLDDSSGASATAAPRRKRQPYSFELVLKKWFDMPKSQEWRCFVRDRRLLGKLCRCLFMVLQTR